MYAVIFETLLNSSHDKEYGQVAAHMESLVKKIPGFISFNSVRAEDGRGITVSYFNDQAAIQAWKSNPEHLLAQQLGRDKFYTRYSLRVCQVQSEKEWPSKE